MKIDFDKLTKGVLTFSFLLIAFSLCYYYVIFLPQKEEARLEQQRQEQLAKEGREQQALEQELQEKEEAERALDTCLADAESDYHEQWYRECKSQGKLTGRCILLHEMTFDEYAKQNNIPNDPLSSERLEALLDFYEEKDECSCRLPLENADRINQQLQDDKDECFKKYPQK